MNESLTQMVKDTPTDETPVTFNEEELSTPTETEEVPTEENIIKITSLTEWFDSSVENFPNIRKPTVSIQGIDASEQLIVTIAVPGSEDKRKLYVFNDAHITPVLDLPAMDMQIYNNGFRIIYEYGDGIFIKSYGIRTGLISVFCNDIQDLLVPYVIVRSKKNSEQIEVLFNDVNTVTEKIMQPLDFEALQIRYKQSSKAEGLQTNLDAVKWLIDRQSTISDINHHLQIDNAIIDTLT